ncbi:MAG: hypothetical protein NZ555_13420 [Geminicoccaceae bacterium]|nr:hypothetical protein [Geminicoccaceae bacterium]
MLELGYRLSGGVPEVLEACPVARDGGTLQLVLGHPAVDPADEAVRGRLEAAVAALGLDRAEFRVESGRG